MTADCKSVSSLLINRDALSAKDAARFNIMLKVETFDVLMQDAVIRD